MQGEVRRERLAAARLYLCIGERPDLAATVRAAVAAGVDIVQFREKGAEWRTEMAGLALLREAAPAALYAANDRADLAVASGADLLHVGQEDIPPALARRIVGPEVLIGVSTHTPDQVLAAVADPEVAYFCVGPVWPTPTKPGRPAPGLALLRFTAGLRQPKPWFAIGGVDASRLDAVLEAGAQRVVVVRAVADAPDPGAAAGALATRLATA
ncbi:MAG: thiamine phosphate synthase [Mycobacteriales bacterium]